MLNLNLTRKNVVFYITFLCLLTAFASFAQGGYLLIKANFAQYLLNKAWQQQIALSGDLESGDQKSNINVKPWPWADIYPIAKLNFERFNIDQIVLNNDSGQALAFGPGLNRIDAKNISNINNESLNVVIISAHNDTHFSFLSELKLNDSVTLTLKSGRSQTVKVSNITIIDTKTEQLVLSNVDENVEGEQNDYNDQNKPLMKELILVTCYPFVSIGGETTLRYVVRLS